MSMKEFKLEISKKGLPCLWECGGGYTHTGEATIITGNHGERKKAIYIRRRGELACSLHALIPVQTGDYIVEAEHHREDFIIQIWRITHIPEVKYVDWRDIARKEAEKNGDNPEFFPYCQPYVWEKHIPKYYTNAELVCEFSENEWNIEPPEFLRAAIEAVQEKATCYHCRGPHFIVE